MPKNASRDPNSIKTGQITIRLALDVRRNLMRRANELGVDEGVLARIYITKMVESSAEELPPRVSNSDGLSNLNLDVACMAIVASLPRELLAGETQDAFRERWGKGLEELKKLGKIVRLRLENDLGGSGGA